MPRHRKSKNVHGRFEIAPRRKRSWMLRVVDLVADAWIVLLPTVFLGWTVLLVMGYCPATMTTV